jgi:hypothetical protein
LQSARVLAGDLGYIGGIATTTIISATLGTSLAQERDSIIPYGEIGIEIVETAKTS